MGYILLIVPVVLVVLLEGPALLMEGGFENSPVVAMTNVASRRPDDRRVLFAITLAVEAALSIVVKPVTLIVGVVSTVLIVFAVIAKGAHFTPFNDRKTP